MNDFFKDNVIPSGKWEFNEEVTACFDNMLERSIPNYDGMRKLVTEIGKTFVKPNTNIIDLGCSTGGAIAPFVKEFQRRNSYKMYDVSQPMLKRCYERFQNYVDVGAACVDYFDIRNGIKDTNTSLILSILTLQFTPIEYRHKILKSVFNSLNHGGAFILVEKVLGSTSFIDDILVNEYYSIKSENAYSGEQIQQKKKSLEGVLVPITAKWNDEILRDTGFKQVDCFWRSLNFAGWIAIKE